MPSCGPFRIATYMYTCGFMTVDDILNLHETPYEVLPAPGADYVNVCINISLNLQYKSTPYENGGDILIYLGDSDILRVFPYSLIQHDHDVISCIKPHGINYYNTDDIVNKPLYFKNDGDAYINGDSVIHYNMIYGLLPIHHYPY
jgi:hypothetical protein